MMISNDRNIPDRLLNELAIHIALFKARIINPRVMAAQIMLVAGPPGAGKTRGIIDTLEWMGFKVVVIPGAILNGQYEGDSFKPVIEKYLLSLDHDLVIVIDDFELTPAGKDPLVVGTKNGEILNNGLMQLADNPFELTVSNSNQPTKTIEIPNPPAIIMTVNSPDKVYEPLRRPSRCHVFEWVPTAEDMKPMVQALYPSCEPKEIDALLALFPDQQIAFFEQLGLRSMHANIAEYLRENENVPFRELPFSEIADHIATQKSAALFEDLMSAGKALAKADGNTSYLKPLKSQSMKQE